MFQVQDTDSAEVREAKLKCQASFQAMKDKQKEHEEAVKVAVSKQDDVTRSRPSKRSASSRSSVPSCWQRWTG